LEQSYPASSPCRALAFNKYGMTWADSAASIPLFHYSKEVGSGMALYQTVYEASMHHVIVCAHNLRASWLLQNVRRAMRWKIRGEAGCV